MVVFMLDSLGANTSGQTLLNKMLILRVFQWSNAYSLFHAHWIASSWLSKLVARQTEGLTSDHLGVYSKQPQPSTFSPGRPETPGAIPFVASGFRFRDDRGTVQVCQVRRQILVTFEADQNARKIVRKAQLKKSFSKDRC